MDQIKKLQKARQKEIDKWFAFEMKSFSGAALIMLLLLFLFTSVGCTLSHGSSRDVIQGWDSGIVWNHAYLKNDHKTVYCFDNGAYKSILDESQLTQKEVIVTYETHLIEGALCFGGQDYDNVIITGIKFVGE